MRNADCGVRLRGEGLPRRSIHPRGRAIRPGGNAEYPMLGSWEAGMPQREVRTKLRISRRMGARAVERMPVLSGAARSRG